MPVEPIFESDHEGREKEGKYLYAFGPISDNCSMPASPSLKYKKLNFSEEPLTNDNG